MPVHPGKGRARSRPRPLGLLTIRSSSFLEQEKREFRQGLKFISQIIQNENSGECPPSVSKQSPALYNNAHSAKYYNRVPNKVVNSQSIEPTGHFRLLSSACSRVSNSDQASVSSLHCEVLGPVFCTDCSRTRLKETNSKKQRVMFPDIGTANNRAQISTDNLQQPSTSPADTNYRIANTLACGCDISTVDILTNILFTEHDVYSRVRHAHQSGSSIVDRRMAPGWGRPNTLEVKCEAPDSYMNISASVHFNSPTEVGQQHFFLE